jgi:signal transduction histidine kinase/ActR/RegA family two-component response regulator
MNSLQFIYRTFKAQFQRGRGGLRKRFLSYFILLIIVLMSGVFVVVEKNDRAVILMEGKKRGLSNVKYLAALSTAPFLMYDYTKLEQNVDEVAKEPDVVYAVIHDQSGSIVAHSQRDDLIGTLMHDPLSLNAVASDSELVQDFRIPGTGEEIWDIAYPIFQPQDVKWGMVRIGFSKETLRAEILRNRRDLVIVTLVAVLLAGTAATFLSAKILGPIRKLSNGALSISKGDLQQEISIHTGDEIEELSNTFNRMTRELAKNRDKQKRLIEQLSAKYRQLKREIAARERLEEEIVNAERLRALGEMSSGVAHDFNNILGAILGRAQLLIEKSSGNEVKKGLAIIEKAALDGAETVHRIQEFTRVSADGTSFHSMDINEVIKDAVEFTRTRWKDEAEAWGIPIELHSWFEEIPAMMADASALREVFTNLIINAVDAMPEGGTINIRTHRDGDMAVVKVADTGIGMSGEVQKRTFDPFFSTKGTRGSGLGLSICYGIITRHRGRIIVESCEGKGSTLTVRIPLTLSGRKETVQDLKARGSTSAKVLVIDDDEIMRAVLADTLRQVGCRVRDVGSGSEGIEIFSKEDFDMVLTDLGMRGMSGWEVIRLVKERSPMIPVALVTGWGAKIDSTEIKKRNVDFVVTKPFQIEDLREVVREAMRKRPI